MNVWALSPDPTVQASRRETRARAKLADWKMGPAPVVRMVTLKSKPKPLVTV